jgi:hypothetical protein
VLLAFCCKLEVCLPVHLSWKLTLTNYKPLGKIEVSVLSHFGAQIVQDLASEGVSI